MPKTAKLGRRGFTEVRQTKGPRCILCEKTIRGQPSIMKLQITSEEPGLLQKAKEFGLASETWRQGGSMTGPFHKDCFKRASILWKIAFETRAISPRR